MTNRLLQNIFSIIIICFSASANAQLKKSRFTVIVMAEKNSIHRPFVDAAIPWLEKLAADSNFTIDYIENADKINDAFLAKYRLFIQLDYPPYTWSDTAKAAFEKYITKGKNHGWIGFHHATLLGEFDGYKIWPWFSHFMGGIRFKDYIPAFATATVNVEDKKHACMKGLPDSFTIEKEEWYTYDKSPRANVRVLASVNEHTYTPDTKTKMGDHPVVWTNEKMKARNVYIFMGHHAGLLQSEYYIQLFTNAIFWAANVR
jgi:type 1 glutamine amidotransferase